MNDLLLFPPELLTKDATARLLSVSISKVQELTNRGFLTAVKDDSRMTKYRLADVRAYIRERAKAVGEELPEVNIHDFPPELLSKQDAAYLLGYRDARYLNPLIESGALRPVDDGSGRPKFRYSDVRAYVANLPERIPA